MGKAYKEKDHVGVELTTGDVVKRVVDTGGEQYMTIQRAVMNVAWEILNTVPSATKLIEGKKFTISTVEALDGKFIVTFRNDKADLSGAPKP